MDIVFVDDNIKYRDRSYIASNLSLIDKYELYWLRRTLLENPDIPFIRIIFRDKSQLTINKEQIKAFLNKPILTKPIRETFATLKIQSDSNSLWLLIFIGVLILLFLLSIFFLCYKNVYRRR